MKNLLIAVICLGTCFSSFSQCSFTVAGVPAPMRQQTDMGCWATVLTMMYEWKQKQKFTVDEVINQIGNPYKDLYEQDEGLNKANKNNLILLTGLHAEAPTNYTASGWCGLLKSYGPLWITTDELPYAENKTAIHARLLYAITTGSDNNTSMFFIDPATATTAIEDFNDFIVKYESELKKIYNKNFQKKWPSDFEIRIQIIHW